MIFFDVENLNDKLQSLCLMYCYDKDGNPTTKLRGIIGNVEKEISIKAGAKCPSLADMFDFPISCFPNYEHEITECLQRRTNRQQPTNKFTGNNYSFDQFHINNSVIGQDYRNDWLYNISTVCNNVHTSHLFT